MKNNFNLKSALLILFTISIAGETFAEKNIDIYSRRMSNGGPNGYGSTSKIVGTTKLPIPFVSPELWPTVNVTEINCSGPGYDICPKSVSQSETYYDAVDIQYINQLNANADALVSNGTMNGEQVETILVGNEQYYRTYKIIWVTLNNETKFTVSKEVYPI